MTTSDQTTATERLTLPNCPPAVSNPLESWRTPTSP